MSPRPPELQRQATALSGRDYLAAEGRPSSRRPSRARPAPAAMVAASTPATRFACTHVRHALQHVVVVPILLGRGVRLWDGVEGLEKDYRVEVTPSPSGVTHVTFTRAGV